MIPFTRICGINYNIVTWTPPAIRLIPIPVLLKPIFSSFHLSPLLAMEGGILLLFQIVYQLQLILLVTILIIPYFPGSSCSTHV